MALRRLTRADREQIAQQVVAEPEMLPSPVKGWNTRDALDAMDPLDAVTLDNWYPDAGGCVVRNGFQSFCTGIGTGPVETLAEFNAGSVRKLIAACDGKLLDISAGGVFSGDFAPADFPIDDFGGADFLAVGFTNNRWQTESFLSRLWFANGVDNAQVYDGTTCADIAFTGVAKNTLVGWRQYQQRLFAWQNNSALFWYAPLNSISGALTSYDLSAFAPNGGNVTAVTTFSHDGGNGVQDFIVFIMSSGDALIYFGNDPGDAAAWSLVGRYRVAAPVSPRAVANYGAEAFMTCADDHIPLQQQLVALKLGQLPPRSKVSSAVQAAVRANAAGFGWQALYYPRGRRLLFNIPNPNGTFDQHICNTGTVDDAGLHPWCRFVGMPAICWSLFEDGLYFGSTGGTVYLADTGNLDVLGPINASGQQAWNTFNDARRKAMKTARPLVQVTGSQGLAFGLGFDYGDLNIGNAVAVGAQGSPWDISPWDTSPWSPESTVTTQWRISGGSGVAVGVGLDVAATGQVIWLRTDLKFEPGMAL